MPASGESVSAIQKRIWAGSLPLHIRLAAADCRTYDQADPYMILVPRLSYLPFLLPRLHVFFSSSLIDPTVSAHDAWFSFQELPLKWHYPLGLLYDLYSGAAPADAMATRRGDAVGAETLPWNLTIHYTDFPADQLFQLDAEGRVLLDAYINSVKEADFIRNGTAKAVMSLSKSDSSSLWKAVEEHDLPLFNTVNNKLLNPPGSMLRHVPIKAYLPTSSHAQATDTANNEQDTGDDEPHAGSVRVVQSLVAPMNPARQLVTLGAALNEMLPSVFPSRRNPVLACPVLHGAVLPLSATMEDLGRAASYTDGFLHVVIVPLS